MNIIPVNPSATLKNHEHHVLELEGLLKSTEALYVEVKDYLQMAKDLGTSFINNPVLKLENQVIQLKYLIMHQEMNLKFYQEEIAGFPQNTTELEAQLESMYVLTSTYIRQYQYLNNEAERMIRPKQPELVAYAVSA